MKGTFEKQEIRFKVEFSEREMEHLIALTGCNSNDTANKALLDHGFSRLSKKESALPQNVYSGLKYLYDEAKR